MSRLTFHKASAAVAWQKQLREHYAAEGLPQGMDAAALSLEQALVRPVSRRLAEHIILRYEWLGTMAATDMHYGLMFGLQCAGVCCVAKASVTGGVHLHAPFALERHQLRILARGACVHWAPPGANSKLVAWTCRLLVQDDPQTKLLLAYSDTDAGEIGTIYQACNWLYIGQGAATTQYVAPAGRVYDQKLPFDLARQHGGTRAAWHQNLLAHGWRLQHANPKHRYVWLLDKRDRALRARLEALRQPYPKRLGPTGVDSDTAPDQGAEAGAHPSVGLQQRAGQQAVRP